RSSPARSVLRAAVRLEVVTLAFSPYVLPAPLVSLCVLFFFQEYGTARVGGVFGPIMLVWFATLATLGALEIVREPSILHALNPWYGARLLLDHGDSDFLVICAVLLSLSGAGGLCSRLCHFGRA